MSQQKQPHRSASSAPSNNSAPNPPWAGLNAGQVIAYEGVIGNNIGTEIKIKKESNSGDIINFRGIGMYKKVGVEFPISGYISVESRTINIDEFAGKGGTSSGYYGGTFVSDNKIEGNWGNGRGGQMTFSLTETARNQDPQLSAHIDEIGSHKTAPIEPDEETGTADLNDQAIREARAVWETVYSKCGDSYFTLAEGVHMTQYKDVTFQAEPQELREVDRLNGYEWIGKVHIDCRLRREAYRNHWGDWGQSGRASTNVQKKKGKWTVDNIFIIYDRRNTKPDCSKIPPG